MLSVCIPVYNVDVRELVGELVRQFIDTHIEGEVIVLDDGSNNQYRKKNIRLADLKYVRYYEQNNRGRAKTRNQLAEYAVFDKLVFIDGDCMVPSNYITTYTQPSNYAHKLVIGGLSYASKTPERQLRLRWNYGRKREATIKYDDKSISFLSSNFMIDSTLFQSIKFDEKIIGYGNEDTLFGIQLRRLQIPFIAIDNRVMHLGLEPGAVFLSKTKESLKNLWLIYNRTQIKELESHKAIKVLKTKQPHFTISLLSFVFKITETPITAFLTKIYPSIFIFDVYKLFYLFKLKHSNL